MRQHEWERELREHYLDEQAGIESRECQLKARKHQEKVRQDKREQRETDIRREEEARRK